MTEKGTKRVEKGWEYWNVYCIEYDDAKKVNPGLNMTAFIRKKEPGYVAKNGSRTFRDWYKTHQRGEMPQDSSRLRRKRVRQSLCP